MSGKYIHEQEMLSIILVKKDKSCTLRKNYESFRLKKRTDLMGM